MKAKISDAKRAVDLYIQYGKSYGQTVEFNLENARDNGRRDPYKVALQKVGFDYNLEIEIIPGKTKLAPKEVLAKWIEEKVITVIE